ncbi:MAG: hypothetical protein AVO35_07985 [Candidatus Aegiribacteria sp. MLS_C]|nr:MAG: hypothetical protein AVO35_07985 [Candidatus Aegiribacteria sp. MLS_C]
MWMKEIRETLRQAAFVMSFFVLVPLLYIMDTEIYDTGWSLIDYLSNGMDFFVLISALYLAYGMFRSEDDQGALEYLLSVPLRRSSLFAAKMVPRISVCAVLLTMASVFNSICGTGGSVLHSLILNWGAGYLYLLLLMVFIQLCGLVLNIVGARSWSTSLVLAFMVLMVWKLVAFTFVLQDAIAKVFGWRASYNFMLTIGRTGQTVIDFAVFFLPVLYILKSLAGVWDMKPIRYRENVFQRKVMLPLAVFIVLLAGSVSSSHWDLSHPLLMG